MQRKKKQPEYNKVSILCSYITQQTDHFISLIQLLVPVFPSGTGCLNMGVYFVIQLS
jgi:hypothetical protein